MLLGQMSEIFGVEFGDEKNKTGKIIIPIFLQTLVIFLTICVWGGGKLRRRQKTDRTHKKFPRSPIVGEPKTESVSGEKLGMFDFLTEFGLGFKKPANEISRWRRRGNFFAAIVRENKKSMFGLGLHFLRF